MMHSLQGLINRDVSRTDNETKVYAAFRRVGEVTDLQTLGRRAGLRDIDVKGGLTALKRKGEVIQVNTANWKKIK